MAFDFAKRILPSWKNAALALLAAGLLILAFPDFEYWFLAWFALVPLMWAVEREASVGRSFVVGWLFGTAFFFGTCWWLTYAPIHYAAFPWPLAYFLILIVSIGAGIFPAIFAAALSALLKRFGSWAFLAAPFVWVFSEFLRYWLTANNWNAIGYSQAFAEYAVPRADIGGVYLSSFLVVLLSATILGWLLAVSRRQIQERFWSNFASTLAFGGLFLCCNEFYPVPGQFSPSANSSARVIALQPNVPMSGVDYAQLGELRQRQFDLAEIELKKLRTTNNELPTTVILPESPMNFMYNDDREFQQFVREFTTRNNVSLIFNSAEPDATNGKYFNSAMMIGADGKVAAQYDIRFFAQKGD